MPWSAMNRSHIASRVLGLWRASKRSLRRSGLRSLTVAALTGGLAFAQPTLKVRLKPNLTDSTIEIPLERYVAAVVAGESATFRSDEALKSMAVSARTFAIQLRGRHAKEGYDLCGTTHCQRLELEHITPRIDDAARATAGELLWYNGKPIFACYSRDCGGITEDASAVWSDTAAPFLRSHPDPYCTRQSATAWNWSATPDQIAAALRKSELRVPADLSGLAVARKTASGRARELALTGTGESVRVAASSFRFAIGRALGFNTVRSDRWEASVSGARIEFRGIGEGHGVGLCQKGADQMGIEGQTYRDILSFYFPGAALGATARGLAWVRLGGETLALFSTQPDQDRAILPIAERQVREIAGRIGLPAPASIEIRIYPDIETFRNATGESGTVAGLTTGRRIALQPITTLRSRGVLESTLRHELTHVFLETQARPNLPIWFREGLAAYLSDGPKSPSPATARVATLVQAHGLPAILDWLRTGLPSHVR
jgi:stage II sporulation protein D